MDMANGGGAPTAHYERMGVTLLARTPPTALESLQKPNANWQVFYEHCEQRLSSLRNWRWSWWAHWARCAEFFLPRRYDWVITANRMNRGGPVNDQIIDTTPVHALNVCASGMWSGLTNPSERWFGLDVGLPWLNLDADGRAWLDDTEDKLFTLFDHSNFYSVMAQAFEDLCCFGTSPVIIYEDESDGVRFYLPCAGEYFLDVGGRLEVDTLYREFTLNTLQIVDMFGLEQCPVSVRNAWAQGGSSLQLEFIVAHAIEPNFPLATKEDRRAKASILPGFFPFREIYWIRGTMGEEPLSVRGFHDKPFIAMRCSVKSNDAYGRSFCMDALGDGKQIQIETLRKAEFMEKGVRPPMGADIELKNDPLSTLPGGTTFMATGDGKTKKFFPLFEPNPGWVAPIVTDIALVSQRLEKALFVDVFQAIAMRQGVQPLNELELTMRNSERLQRLGPVVNLVTKELDQVIKRCLSVMQRRGMLMPMPASMRQTPLKVSYNSILKLAQKSSKSIAMRDVLATAGALSSAAKAAALPDPLRTMKLDEFLEEYTETNNVDTSLFFTKDQVSQHDAARAKVMAQQRAPGDAMAAVTAAHTLAQTPLSPGNALSAITGPLQGAQGGVP